MNTATTSALSRIILVGSRSRLGSGQNGPAIRRYRLARLHVNHDAAAQPAREGRHDHLRRSYD